MSRRCAPFQTCRTKAEPVRGRCVLRSGLLAALLLLGGTALGKPPLMQLGAEDDWYPYSAVRDGQLQGMAVELVRAAFAAADTPVELIPYPYARCMHLVAQGQLAGCFNTTPNEQIRRDYLLPRLPLFSDQILLWARQAQATPLHSLGQLRGRRVAVTLGYEYGPAFDNFHDLQRVAVRQDLFAFRMLARGRVDYSVAFRGTSEQLFRDNPELRNQFRPVLLVHPAELYLSFSRQHPHALQLQQHFDLGMQRLHEQGTYASILKRWHHQMPATQPASP